MAGLTEIVEWYRARIGTHLGHSDWLTVTAEDVERFADATRDWQPIHLDKAQAAQGPYGVPVVHGFLTLALVPYLTSTLLDLSWTTAGINYRVDRVRFHTPVPVDGRVRAGATLAGSRARPGGYVELVLAVVVEVEGDVRPACTLDHTRLYTVADDAELPRARPVGEPLDPRP